MHALLAQLFLSQFLSLSLACAHSGPEPEVRQPKVEEAAAPAPESPADPGAPLVLGEADDKGNPTVLEPGGPASSEPGATSKPVDPAALYAGCRDRVEGDDKAGECTTAADCAPAGCSKEVCVSRSAAADLNTTCDRQPCFDILDTCGCTDGLCTWTLENAP